MERKPCESCEDAPNALKGEEIRIRLLALPGWKTNSEHHIYKSFPFPNFKTALEFVNKIGAIAEEEGHHPDIILKWGEVSVTLFTHSIDGLSENDFLMAEMIDGLKNPISNS